MPLGPCWKEIGGPGAGRSKSVSTLESVSSNAAR
jgi:hypothetical protein